MTMDSSLYHIYRVGNDLIHFDVDQSSWTVDQISDMADMLKNFVLDTDIEEFKRLGRFDIVEKLTRDTK